MRKETEKALQKKKKKNTNHVLGMGVKTSSIYHLTNKKTEYRRQ